MDRDYLKREEKSLPERRTLDTRGHEDGGQAMGWKIGCASEQW